MAGTLCRRCLLRESFPDDYRQYVEGLLRRVPANEKTPEETYERRLSLCRSCDQLDRGTCMGCGCLVELRAAYRNQKCPFSKWPVRPSG